MFPEGSGRTCKCFRIFKFFPRLARFLFFHFTMNPQLVPLTSGVLESPDWSGLGLVVPGLHGADPSSPVLGAGGAGRGDWIQEPCLSPSLTCPPPPWLPPAGTNPTCAMHTAVRLNEVDRQEIPGCQACFAQHAWASRNRNGDENCILALKLGGGRRQTSGDLGP